ncbi:MAG: hypothetical protein V1886_03325 [archaeon]
MVSLDYIISNAEKNDLISSCVITGSQQYHLSEISKLPYGYLFYFRNSDGHGSSFAVNIDNNKIEVLPDCGFASKVQSFLEEYFRNKA